jgi:hypothetical protein
VGTPNFLAPERAGGPSHTDIRSDLYSLGCTAFHLLTGEPPYSGGDWHEKLARHRFESVPSVRARRPDVPEALAAVVARLMAKSPEERYSSPAALLAALREPPPLPAMPVAPSRKQETPASLRRGVIAAVLLAGLLCVVAAQSGGRNAPPPAPTPTPALAPEERPLPFAVEGGKDFATLAEAVAAAPDGGTITVRGAGPHAVPPLRWRGKALTLRGEGTDRPCLEIRPAGESDRWSALLTSDRPLSLHHLELRHPPTATAAGGLVCAEGAALRLRGCRLSTADAHPAVTLRQAPELDVNDCDVVAAGGGLAVEVGQPGRCKLRLDRCRISAAGAALALWGPESSHPTAVEVSFTRSTAAAARFLSVRSLPGPLTVTAAGNEFTCRESLLHFTAERGAGDWRRLTTWHFRDNRYLGPAGLSVDGQARPLSELRGGAESVRR